MFFFRSRNKIQPSSLPRILYSRWQPRSQVFSLALNSAITCRQDACCVTNIPRGALGTRVNPDTCGRENQISKWIRVDVEIFESGNTWLLIHKYPDTYGGGLNERLDDLPPSEPLLSGIQAYDQAPQRSLFVSGKSMQIVEMTLTLKRGQKGWPQLFSETQCNEPFLLKTKVLCLVSFILHYDAQSS